VRVYLAGPMRMKDPYYNPDTGHVFYYKRCCRVHRLVIGQSVGNCGLCGQRPREAATAEEYLAQVQL
jgi:hypothetical protein